MNKRKLTVGLAAATAVATVGIVAAGIRPAVAQTPQVQASATCPYHNPALMDPQTMGDWMVSSDHAAWMTSDRHTRMHDQVGGHMMRGAEMMPERAGP